MVVYDETQFNLFLMLSLIYLAGWTSILHVDWSMDDIFPTCGLMSNEFIWLKKMCSIQFFFSQSLFGF